MMKNFLYFFSYLCLRAITWPFTLLSYPQIHRIGAWMGPILFFLCKKFRKRALSNLALAKDLHLDPQQIRSLAKASFSNLFTTCLEYAKLAQEKEISKVATCLNPEAAQSLLSEGKGVIFFCGHQANWEILFLEGTSRMPGVAIGRPVKNHYLYQWILSIRQKFGGTIVTPKNAAKEGLRALRQGKFLGIVGDQGMPDSGFHSPFLGQKAWTSPLPAILSYRSGRPILVATTYREKGRYWIHYSDPIWPCLDNPMEVEIPRLMTLSLNLLAESIMRHPGQWLWQHNRWKQQVPGKLKKDFRHESLGIIFPKQISASTCLAHIDCFRSMYPTELITVFAPQGISLSIQGIDVQYYISEEQILRLDYRPKLIFDFTENTKIRSHFLKLAAFHVVTPKELAKIAQMDASAPLTQILPKALSYAG